MKLKIFKKIFLVFGVIICIFLFCGCSPKSENNLLVINSYEESKIMPSTIFEVEINKEYALEEKYEFKVKYGTLMSIYDNEHFDPNIALLKIHNDEDTVSETFSEIMAWKTLLEVKPFLTIDNKVDYDIIKGEFKNFSYNQETTLVIPKDTILGTSGILRLSFLMFDLDENNEIMSNNCDGSLIRLSYIIEDDKIYFSKARR